MPRARSENFKLENMRGSYLHILKAQKIEDAGKVTFKHNGTFLWPKSTPALIGKKADGSDINVMDEAVRVATEEWGDKAVDWIKNGLIKSPFLDGDGPQGLNKKTGQRHAGYEGHRFIRASSNEDRPPEAFDNKAGADGKLVKITDPKRIYAGAYYHVVVNLFAWENAQGGKGLSFGLNMIQFAKDGERLGGDGGGDPNAFFQGVKGADKAPSSVKDGEGAGGLFA